MGRNRIECAQEAGDRRSLRELMKTAARIIRA
jgi:hypothetical protein